MNNTKKEEKKNESIIKIYLGINHIAKLIIDDYR